MARVTTRAPYKVRCSYSAKQLVSERENRCVLSMFLNVDNVGAERMSSGRLFIIIIIIIITITIIYQLCDDYDRNRVVTATCGATTCASATRSCSSSTVQTPSVSGWQPPSCAASSPSARSSAADPDCRYSSSATSPTLATTSGRAPTRCAHARPDRVT